MSMIYQHSMILFLLLIGGIYSCNDSKPGDKTIYDVVFRESLSGTYEKWTTGQHSYKYFYTYTDRGRGPELKETITLNEHNFISSQTIKGVNYSKVSVDEHLISDASSATCHNPMGTKSDDFSGHKLYFRHDGSPAFYEILAQCLLRSKDGTVAFFPTGGAELIKKISLTLSNDVALDLIAIKGLGLDPSYLWMQGEDMICKIAGNRHVVRQDFADLRLEMKNLQDSIENESLRLIAQELTHDIDQVIIKDVNVFTKSGIIHTHQDVIIKDGKIVEIQDAQPRSLDQADMLIDGAGKTLMPGLFDMHTHNTKFRGLLHLAGGVTVVRDLANNKQLKNLAAQFDNNEILGPHIVTFCGIIDGSGPYANRRNVVETLEEGLAEIEDYHRLGYQQIKLYSSIRPEWVRPLTQRSRALGMRVSGHIPAFMTATQAINQGYNEIQHINMVMLNFMSDTIDTRTPLRFTMPAQHSASLDLKSQEYTDFVDLLLDKDILIDPTVAIFENKIVANKGELSPTYGMVAERFPVINQRSYYAGGLPKDESQKELYQASFDKMLEVINDLYEKGVALVPGTDGLPGFLYHRELELYVQAGIPTAEVLRLATIKSAEITGVASTLGSVDIGKSANLIMIDGNPVEDISDIRKVEWTMKGGKIYYADELYSSVGIKHFK